MDRYDDLDLECERGGGVVEKVAVFGGMFKKSLKSSEPSLKAQDSLSVSSELSKSDESLTDSSTKEKGGVFKGMFKKTNKAAKEEQPQVSLSVQNPELSVSSDSLTDNKPSKEKSGVFGGKLKRSPKPGHVRRPSQDLLEDKFAAIDDSLSENTTAKEKSGVFGGILKRHARRPSQDLLDNEFTASTDSLSENTTTRETGGVFSGMFKKSPKPSAAQSQEDLSASSELSGNKDSLSVNSNTKESGGMFSGMFKKPPKPSGAKTQSQEDLSAPSELSGSKENLSVDSNTKETGGVFNGMFKKTPKPPAARTESQEDLSAPSELSGSKDSLSVNSNTKEAGGMFSGMFRKSPKPFGSRTQSEEDLSAPSELSGSKDSLSVNSNTKETGGKFGGLFKKPPKPLGKRTPSQDDLSDASELSGSNSNLSENTKEKGGIFSGVFRKKVARSQSKEDLTVDSELSASSDSLIEKPSKDKEKTEHSGDSNENTSTAEKPKAKQSGFSAMMKSTFSTDKQEKESGSDSEEMLDIEESQPSHKQSTFAGAMEKLNPFRSANKNEKQSSSDEEDPPASSEKSSGHKQKNTEEDAQEHEQPGEEKPKPVKSNMIQRERKERSETPTVPPRPSKEEMKRTSIYDEGNEDDQELNKTAARQKQKSNHQSQSDDEGLMDGSAGAREGEEESKAAKVKKPRRHNPFMQRAGAKAQSDDEGLDGEDDSSPKEETKDEEGKEKTETKVKKPKKHNPFMPSGKGKGIRRNAQDGAVGAGENGKRTLFDQLEDLRIDPSQPEDRQDFQGLMDWWNTVESWEDTPQEDDMTEKQEAKAFAVTADKVQKGIRVFNKLFSERAESLWQHVIDLNSIADGLDKFNKNTKIAQITGGSTSAIGGVATITGLALAPVTFGVSLIITAVGLGVATAGGLTSAGAGISNQVNNSQDRKKVEKIVNDYMEKMVDLNKCLKFIKQGIENMKRFDLIKMKEHAYNRDFPVLSKSIYEDGAMAGKAILISANEIMRVVQIANVAGSTAARAVQIASMATGVLTGLFVGMDIYFVAKDSKELKKGAKSEFAAKIREVATQLHDGLVELNTIREELQCSGPANDEGTDTAPLDSDKKDDKHDSSSEDEIDRIKKAIKKDYENREYV
ncbi:nuclear pore complex protein DDB_G0274915-like isoform X3 [Gymnodraco acuticeps]|uniref:Nuclear pore complex protein DDB_G0274915-like isoform X3 n=1 Tax=Gymnodraco acuticeps TaxID=8218 RepID=A0A6P8TI33_GYMAC|nr:nuclear pore complex protein DDB_G0274915-like isoform X3 [Gymnodraco acuticeps]